MVPVLALSVSPAGSEPEANFQVKGAKPFTALSVAE
jgi:hypothetical protein